MFLVRVVNTLWVAPREGTGGFYISSCWLQKLAVHVFELQGRAILATAVIRSTFTTASKLGYRPNLMSFKAIIVKFWQKTSTCQNLKNCQLYTKRMHLTGSKSQLTFKSTYHIILELYLYANLLSLLNVETTLKCRSCY